MTPAQAKRSAFLLRSIEQIDEWIETFEDPDHEKGDGKHSFESWPNAVLVLELTDARGSTRMGFGDDDTILDRFMVISGLKHIRGLCQNELRDDLGVEVPDEAQA
jgi:hypothetical protein